MKNITSLAILILLLCIIVTTPVFAIEISLSSEDGKGSVAVSDSYRLSTDTALKSESTLDGHNINQDRQLNGDGNNYVIQNVGGNGYDSKNVVKSSGPLSISTSTAASTGSASISQGVSGTGNIIAELQGTQGEGLAEQKTNVIDGSLSLSQSLSTGGLLSVGQKTEMSGGFCNLQSNSYSNSNAMLVSGNFYKVYDIKADLTAASSERALTMGDISAYGDNCLDKDTLGMIGSKNIGLAFDSSYIKDGKNVDKAPEFNGLVQINAVNMNRGVFESVSKVDRAQASSEAPADSQTFGAKVGDFWGWLPLGNSYDAGVYGPYRRWNQIDPSISLYLLTDSNYNAKGLNTNNVCNAILTGAGIWDAATSQKLYAGTVTPSNNVIRDSPDGVSVLSWEVMSGNSPGHCHTWYNSNSQKDGFFQITDADIDFSTTYPWNTNGLNDGTNYDVETIAVHELGHSLGLADLYNKDNTPYKTQVQQIMNYQYNHPLWLGNGDRQAIWSMYGR